MSKCFRNVIFKTKSLHDLTAGLLHDWGGGQICADVITMSKLYWLDPHHTKYDRKQCYIMYGYHLYF